MHLSRRSLLAAATVSLAARVGHTDAPVTVVAVGDVALAWRVDDAIRQQNYDPFRAVRDRLAAADLAFANVECVLSSAPEVAHARAGQPIIRGSATAARSLASAGIDLASVANNHAFDLGARGALDTHQALRDAGVTPLGGGVRTEDAWQPVIREVRGLRVGWLAITENLNHPPGQGARVAMLGARAVDAVRALDATVDVVVLSLHWGREFTDAPTTGQIALAHRLVDAGADVIIGHHPHVLQSVELYRDRPIVYSLGNFVFGHQPSPRDLSALLELSLQRGSSPIARVALRPVRLLGPLGTPTVVDGALARPVLARVRDASARFRTVFSERDGALEVQLTPAR